MAGEYRTDGSAAFDIYAGNTARPLPKPKRLPDVPSLQKAAAAPKIRFRLSPLTLFGTVICLLMLFLVVFCYVRIYETRSEIGELQDSKAALESEQAALQAQYDDAIDLKQIERRARALGMHEPREEQIVHIETKTADVSEVYVKPEEPNLFARAYNALCGAIREALEYFS